MIMSRLHVSLAGVALAALAVTGCSAPASTPAASPVAPASSAPASRTAPAASGSSSTTSLMVATSPLGKIVVDANGKTLYVFDKDTQGSGASSCSGACAATWPAVTAATTPTLDGVTGEVGMITGTDGAQQVTLNGWPLYYFAKDAKAGDTLGQGVNKIWWVLSPAGEKISS